MFSTSVSEPLPVVTAAGAVVPPDGLVMGVCRVPMLAAFDFCQAFTL